MPRLKLPLALLFALVAGVPCVARAEGEEAPRARPAASRVWTVRAHAGYGDEPASGLSPLRMGEGISVGLTLGHLRLDLLATHFAGQSMDAGGRARYRSSYESNLVQAGVAYETRIAGALHASIGVHSGALFVIGRTTVAGQTVRDDIARWMVGPTASTFVRVSRFDLGVEARGSFLPTAVAAPALVLYAIAGVAF